MIEIPNILLPLEYKAHTAYLKEKESVDEHSIKTLNVAYNLIQIYSLNPIIENLCKKIYSEKWEIVLEFFYATIYCHDIGKLNPFFQKYKMDNIVPNYESLRKKFSDKLENFNEQNFTAHSPLSVLIFLEYYLDKYEEDKKLDNIIKAFAYNILKHHSSFLEDLSNLKCNEILEHYLDYYDFKIIDKQLINNFLNFNNLDNEYLWHLTRLNFGILTKSDYIATAEYMSNYRHSENIISSELKNKIFDSFWNYKSFKDGSFNYNSNAFESFLNTNITNEKNKDNLNYLRNQMLFEALTNYKLNSHKNIFNLECPTGGGKTNCSAALTSMMINDNVKKIFYVFPFNKISEQTENFLINAFHLDDNQIAMIAYNTYKESVNENLTAYENDKLDMMNNQFMNYPLLLMSHVKLFDILKGNSKSDMYNLHSLANSVIILDEIQAYSPEIWSKIYYLIVNYAEIFNIKFIIMSATLPSLDKLVKDDDTKIVNLITNRDKYFLNPNFKDRVIFDKTLMKHKDINDDTIFSFVVEKSEEYYSKYNTCYSVVEFIYKKDASEFSKKYRKDFSKLGYEVMVLSSNILNPKSKKIIKEIKNRRFKKIILICTQCIEAGVDIDMDLGFKDVSVIDSEEQLAGRVNRNASKMDNILYLFNKGKKTIYVNDLRKKVINYDDEYFDILKNKQFNLVYDKVIETLNKKDSSNLKQSLAVLRNDIKNIGYEKIDKNIQIIEDNPKNFQIFIPIDIPLNDFDYYIPNQFIDNNFVSGQKVWDCYVELINNKNFLQLNKMRKIISDFTTSLFINDKMYSKMILSDIFKVEHSFLYLKDVSIFSYEDAFDLSRFDDDIIEIFI